MYDSTARGGPADSTVNPAGAFAGARLDPPATPAPPAGQAPPNAIRSQPDAAPPAAAAAPAAPVSRGFFVSLASHTDEMGARADARSVIVDGQPAHVATSPVGGKTLYRVVLGPYPTRSAAERAGSLAARPFWIYEAQ